MEKRGKVPLGMISYFRRSFFLRLLLVWYNNAVNSSFVNAVIRCLFQTAPLVGLLLLNRHSGKCMPLRLIFFIPRKSHS
jgi:hypothetical protein